MHRGTKVSLAILITAGLLFGAVKLERFAAQRPFEFVPERLGAVRVIYEKEESWGVGLPGDNETGVIVYEMSAEAATTVRAAGLSFFGGSDDVMPARSNHFFQWQPTPVANLDPGARPDAAQPAITGGKVLAGYLDRYGFGIELDPKVEAFINGALAQPGSYVGQGRIGALIVVPVQQRIVFIYSG